VEFAARANASTSAHAPMAGEVWPDHKDHGPARVLGIFGTDCPSWVRYGAGGAALETDVGGFCDEF
jgi:hypothetical protein